MNTVASRIVSLLFTQPFIQAQIKENIKAVRHWPLCVEITGDRWIPLTKASNAEMFAFDDVIMKPNTPPPPKKKKKKMIIIKSNKCTRYYCQGFYKLFSSNDAIPNGW